VAREDGRAVELVDHPGDVGNRAGTVAVAIGSGFSREGLDLNLEARISGRQDAISLRLVVGNPRLPAAWGHPEPVDQDDGVGSGGRGHETSPASTGVWASTGSPGSRGWSRSPSTHDDERALHEHASIHAVAHGVGA
jgi:hypothetical protein